MSRHHEFFYHTTDGRVTAETVIEAFDAFAEHYFFNVFKATRKPCLIVLDNASMHRSQRFQAKKEHWMLRGVCLHFLPTYSPELNLIEILWRKIKYEWLPMAAYQEGYAELKKNVLSILDSVGSEFRITFA